MSKKKQLMLDGPLGDTEFKFDGILNIDATQVIHFSYSDQNEVYK